MAYSKRHGPPTPHFSTGPRCGPYTDETGIEHAGCPYRAVSFGYAPHSGDLATSTFLFLLEALGADEVEAGAPAVGPAGGVFNKLLHENTPILRYEQVVANVCLCRPVTWTSCEDCNGKGIETKGYRLGGFLHRDGDERTEDVVFRRPPIPFIRGSIWVMEATGNGNGPPVQESDLYPVR